MLIIALILVLGGGAGRTDQAVSETSPAFKSEARSALNIGRLRDSGTLTLVLYGLPCIDIHCYRRPTVGTSPSLQLIFVAVDIIPSSGCGTQVGTEQNIHTQQILKILSIPRSYALQLLSLRRPDRTGRLSKYSIHKLDILYDVGYVRT